ncbi:MAG: hypothetical protein LBH86_05340 [Oscillospiraceae bacterium]|jgi:hypothetical protein|nr:hypothetical protein [Oscillospiraceae bacterium]
MRQKLRTGLCALCAVLAAWAAPLAVLAAPEAPKVPLAYFYLTSCASCVEDFETAFTDKLRYGALNDREAVDQVVDLTMINLFSLEGTDRFAEYADRYGLSEDDRYASDQYVFLGDLCLVGAQEIDQRLASELNRARQALAAGAGLSPTAAPPPAEDPASPPANTPAEGDPEAVPTPPNRTPDETPTAPETPPVFPVPPPAAVPVSPTPDTNAPANAPASTPAPVQDNTPPAATPTTPAGTPGAGGPSLVTYFYVPLCEPCAEADLFLEGLEDGYVVDGPDGPVYSELVVRHLNAGERDNLERIHAYFRAYDVPASQQTAPIAFIGESFLQGDDIRAELLTKIRRGEGLRPDRAEGAAAGPDEDPLSAYRAMGVFSTGFLNGLNPCSLSMLLFFLSIVIAKRRNVLKLGLSFLVGKFVTYLLLGTLLYQLLAAVGGDWFRTLNLALKIILCAVSAFLAAMNLRDYFAVKRGAYDRVKMQLPLGLRKFGHRWIRQLMEREDARLLMLVCFLLGAVITVGEFLCTGQIYLATILYTLKTVAAPDLRAVLYFVLYGLAFVTPPLVLLLLVHKGREVFDISNLVRRRLPVIKLLNAALFALFFFVVLFLF